MRIFLVFFVLFVFSNCAIASNQSDKTTIYGAWSGVLGGQQIRACLGSSESSYYYLRHSWGIPLISQSKNEQSWVEMSEENPTGIWKLKQLSSDRLEGQWSDAKRVRTLPIHLSRASVDSPKDVICSDPQNPYAVAYNLPRVDAQKIVVGEPKTFDGKHYRQIKILGDKIVTIELLEDGIAVASINKILNNNFKQGIVGFFDCQASLESLGAGKERDPDFGIKVEIQFWNDHWISIKENSSWDCTLRGPSMSITYRTWDTWKGQEINLLSWIRHTKSGNSENYLGYSLPDELNELIKSKKHNVCSNFDGQYKLSLAKNGMIFSTIESGSGLCTDDIEIPYSKLQKFLTKGKAAVLHTY
jgi:hypothetical protein